MSGRQLSMTSGRQLSMTSGRFGVSPRTASRPITVLQNVNVNASLFGNVLGRYIGRSGYSGQDNDKYYANLTESQAIPDPNDETDDDDIEEKARAEAASAVEFRSMVGAMSIRGEAQSADAVADAVNDEGVATEVEESDSSDDYQGFDESECWFAASSPVASGDASGVASGDASGVASGVASGDASGDALKGSGLHTAVKKKKVTREPASE